MADEHDYGLGRPMRPCPDGWRRLDVPRLDKARWERLFQFLIAENEPQPITLGELITGPKRVHYKLVNAENGYRIAEGDYEFFSTFNVNRDGEWIIESNADDDTLTWFRMKYL